MPVFRGASTLPRAARSILCQTLSDLELIIIDDGSEDETLGVAEALAREDDRVRVLSRPHEGIVSALNAGIDAARAELIARMDADDFALPERLEAQRALLLAGDRGPLDAVGVQIRILGRSGEDVPSMARYAAWINAHTSSEEIHAFRFVESPILHPTILARRRVLELRYRAGDFPEDYELWLRAIEAGYRFGKVPRVLFHWINGSEQLTRTDPRYRAEAFDAVRRRYLLSGPLAPHQMVDLWGAGLTGKPWLRFLLGPGGRAVRHLYDVAPRKIGQTIHGVRVLPPEALRIADGVPLVIAVGAAGAREEIAALIRARGYVPGNDAWFVA